MSGNCCEENNTGFSFYPQMINFLPLLSLPRVFQILPLSLTSCDIPFKSLNRSLRSPCTMVLSPYLLSRLNAGQLEDCVTTPHALPDVAILSRTHGDKELTHHMRCVR